MTTASAPDVDGSEVRRIGPYQIIDLVGQGGMGRVYLAETATGTQVAIKTIIPAYANDPEYRRRFTTEIALAGAVPSSCTAAVLGSDLDNDPAYVVVEYVNGPSLQQHVDHHGGLNLTHLQGVATSMACALAGIHAAGIIHRDLKPANVLLPHGCCKIIDFGIARPTLAPPATSSTPVSASYLAPEVLTGVGAATPAVDVFAWGLTVAFGATGRHPFADTGSSPDADHTSHLLRRIARAEPDLTGLSEPLRSLVTRALTKDPIRRPTARDLVVHLLTTDRDKPAAVMPGLPALPDLDARATPAGGLDLTAPRVTVVGREADLETLSTVLLASDDPTGPTPVLMINGPAGVGKTCLATAWAHTHRAGFNDGVLHLDLAKLHPDDTPLTRLLAGLGVPPESIPDTVDGQTALYQQVIAGRRLLILLDNITVNDQIADLVPRTPTARVVATSRHPAYQAPGVTHLTLGVWPDLVAQQILVSRVGAARINANPSAVADLLTLCGGLPIAVTLIAATAATQPDMPLAALAAHRHTASHPHAQVAGIGHGDDAPVPAVLDICLHALPPAAARLLPLIAIAPGDEISFAAAASIAGLPPVIAAQALHALVEAGLLDETATAGRYRMHDLIRHHVTSTADACLTADDREQALYRLVDFAVHTSYIGDRLLYPHRPPLVLPQPATGCTPIPLADRAAAIAWFTTHHRWLLAIHDLAVDQGWHLQVWRLAWALTTYRWRRGQLHQHRTVWQAALTAADRLHDPAAQAEAHRMLGHAHGQRGNRDAAHHELRQALTLSQQAGDVFGQAHSHHLLAWIADERADPRTALIHARASLDLVIKLNNPIWTAIGYEAIGWYHARLGEYDRAQPLCSEALHLNRAYAHTEGVARALQSLAYITHRTGNIEQAQRYYHDALALRQEIGDTYTTATILERLGDTHRDADHHDDARRAWQQALSLYRAQRRTTHAAVVAARLVAPD